MGGVTFMTSQKGQPQPELNGGDARVGSSTLTPSTIATEKQMWSWKSEGISDEICPLGECNNYSYLQIQFHLSLIQVQKMRIKTF